MIWVVSSDTNTCRIYQYNKPFQLTLIKELKHPENKLKTSDLISDRPGHYQTSGPTRGVYTQSTDPKDVMIDNFSREIAKELDHGRNDHAYKNLIIIASPHMNGLLFQHFNKHVKESVINRIHKDLLHLSEQELLDFLKTHAQYKDEL